MKFPSFGTIILYLFIIWIGYSTYMLYTFMFPKECQDQDACLRPAFKKGDVFQLFLCTSLDDHPLGSKLDCIFHDPAFDLAKRTKWTFQVNLPYETLNNGSLFLHGILTKLMSTRVVTPDVIESKYTMVTTAFLTKYMVPKDSVFNLLSGKGKTNTSSSSSSRKRPVTHWKAKIILNGMEAPFSFPMNALPFEMLHLLQLDYKNRYMPIIYISDARQRLTDIVPMPKKVQVPVQLPLTVEYEPISVGRLRLTLTIEKSLIMMRQLGFTDTEIDDVKGVFFDTDGYMLLLTITIVSFHIIFDVLAFKNDIQFWRRRQTLEGISFQSTFWNFISQCIITLYLFDQESSYLVTIPSCIATLIELWKMKKLARIEWHGFKLVRRADYRPTEMECKTAELDGQFLRTVTYYVLGPILISAAVYSMLYVHHKSLYSWAIQSLVNCVYCFGFIAMLPQLFINYKLKSVAHLPWRAFTYKAFNTFIDDFFAFLIPSVPINYRLATFRDDIIFLIYLYQRWLYPIDHSRTIVAKFADQNLDEEEDQSSINNSNNNNNNKSTGKNNRNNSVKNNKATTGSSVSKTNNNSNKKKD